MAELQQIVTVEPQYNLLDGGGNGLRPFAQASHRGSSALTATTGTDTKSIRIVLDLPDFVVWQLRTFHFTIEDSTEYARGIFEYYFNPTSDAAGQSTQLNYPLAGMSGSHGTAAADKSQNYIIAGADNLIAVSGEWVVPLDRGSGFSPFDMVTFTDSGGAAPTLALYSTVAPTAACTARYGFTWIGYTYEQMRNSALYTGLSNRD